MNCPQCNTWNPDDKRVCWRCQTELPRPVEKKPRTRSSFLGLPTWGWIMISFLIAFWVLAQCVGPSLISGR